MNKQLTKKKEYLVQNIPKLIENFNYHQGPDLYFYKKVIAKIRKNPLRNLFKRNNFIELLYATLSSWGMNARGAKMKYFDEFKLNILENKNHFELLSQYKFK